MMRVAIIGREPGRLEVDVGGFTPSSRYLGAGRGIEGVGLLQYGTAPTPSQFILDWLEKVDTKNVLIG